MVSGDDSGRLVVWCVPELKISLHGEEGNEREVREMIPPAVCGELGGWVHCPKARHKVDQEGNLVKDAEERAVWELPPPLAWEGSLTREEASEMAADVMAEAKWIGHTATVYCLSSFLPRPHDPSTGLLGYPEYLYGRFVSGTSTFLTFPM